MIETAISKKKWSDSARQMFEFLDTDKNAMLNLDEFVDGLLNLNSGRQREDLELLFHHL
jgi:Ca2+-binding EF-hand superfamily protein